LPKTFFPRFWKKYSITSKTLMGVSSHRYGSTDAIKHRYYIINYSAQERYGGQALSPPSSNSCFVVYIARIRNSNEQFPHQPFILWAGEIRDCRAVLCAVRHPIGGWNDRAIQRWTLRAELFGKEKDPLQIFIRRATMHKTMKNFFRV
jgi:hypothetical protein